MIGRHLAVEPLIKSLPARWGVERFKAVTTRAERRNQDLSHPMMSLKSTGEVVLRSTLGQRQEPDEKNLPRYLIAAPGDVVVNPMWLVGGAVGVSEVVGAVSPDYRVFHTGDHHPRYLHYVLRLASYVDQYVLYTRAQTTFDRRVQQPDLDNLPLPVPPIEVQRAIADYLDRETAHIDTLITKQEHLIATLRERADSAWAAAVAHLEQSYRSLPVRRVIESIVDGPFGSALTSAHYAEAGARVIRLGNIGVNSFRDEDRAYVSMDHFRDLSYHAVARDDVVVAGLGDDRMPLGRAAVVPDLGPALVKADCYRVRSNGLVESSYLAWVLSAPQTREQFVQLSRGSTRSRLNTTVVREARIPVPPVTEQSNVVERSRSALAATEALIAKAEQFIELAKERRAALITAAVTGQIDVRTA